MDRNILRTGGGAGGQLSLSARRAWIEIGCQSARHRQCCVALRKESVDRNQIQRLFVVHLTGVALRKESVDRNSKGMMVAVDGRLSLSARRAWIEMLYCYWSAAAPPVALRKESVDRNSMPLI